MATQGVYHAPRQSIRTTSTLTRLNALGEEASGVFLCILSSSPFADRLVMRRFTLSCGISTRKDWSEILFREAGDVPTRACSICFRFAERTLRYVFPATGGLGAEVPA